eukprot:COSAG06_NODE_2389_length_6965_cov_6.611273_4_plen_73_part_00
MAAMAICSSAPKLRSGLSRVGQFPIVNSTMLSGSESESELEPAATAAAATTDGFSTALIGCFGESTAASRCS